MPKVLWIWVVVDVAFIGYLWWAVKKTDEKQDEVDAQSQALIQEMQAYNKRRGVPLPPADIDAPYEAFMCDSDHPHPRRPAA